MADAAYLKAFKEYSREVATFGDLPAMEREFYGEADRPAAILQASVVERALEVAIKKKLAPGLSNEFVKEMFEFEGVIGTFSDKIAIAYALGIFKSHTFHDLNIIRILRNAFAHLSKPMRFVTPQVAGMCEHLLIPDIAGIAHAPHAFYELAKDLEAAVDRKNPKTRYITACHSIALGLLDFANQDAAEPFTDSILP